MTHARCAIGVSLFVVSSLVAACTSAELLGEQTASLAPTVPIRDTGGDAALTSQWTTTAGTYASTGTVDLKVHNTTSANLTVTVVLRGRGLDARDVTLPFGTVIVNAGSSLDILPAISLIPVQSVGTQSALTLDLAFTDAGGMSHTIASPPLFYNFTSTRYTTAIIYDRLG